MLQRSAEALAVLPSTRPLSQPSNVVDSTCIHCELRLARWVEITDGNVVVEFPLCDQCHKGIECGDIELDKPTTLMLLERLKERGIIDDYVIDLSTPDAQQVPQRS